MKTTIQQNTFTDEERRLAERYQVEPKLCRLIAEIVAEHTEGINQLIGLTQSKKETDPAELPAEHPEDDEPTTGISQLDELIEGASYEATALAHGCLEISLADQRIGEKIRDMLRDTFEFVLKAHSKDDQKYDLECDLLPAIKWNNFLQGYMIGRGLVRI